MRMKCGETRADLTVIVNLPECNSDRVGLTRAAS